MTIPEVTDKRAELLLRVEHVREYLERTIHRKEKFIEQRNKQGELSRTSSIVKAERILIVCDVLIDELANEPESVYPYVEETVLKLERQFKLAPKV